MNYDSDSSGGDEESFTETNVLLGYACKEATDDTISQLGGHPTWLDGATAPSGNLAKCRTCNGLLTLLLQLNGDLPDRFPGHERRLYLLGCRRKACRRKDGSVRGIRATRTSKSALDASLAKAKVQTVRPESPPPQQQQQPKTDIGASLFGVKSSSAGPFSSTNPFSTTASGAAQSNPFASASSLAAKPAQRPAEPKPSTSTSTPTSLAETFASKARISSPEATTAPVAAAGPLEPWPSLSAFPPPYPTYHLDADYEALDTSPAPIPQQTRLVTDMDLDGADDSTNSVNNAEDKSAYESAMDKTFQRFADRLAQNPEQVLRYEFSGQPLLYSREDAVGAMLHVPESGAKVQSKSRVPRCANCGAERVFECQLTPHAITELEAEELGLEGMEWGTVILEVCARDCVARATPDGTVAYVEEWVGVQWEEVVKKQR